MPAAPPWCLPAKGLELSQVYTTQYLKGIPSTNDGRFPEGSLGGLHVRADHRGAPASQTRTEIEYMQKPTGSGVMQAQVKGGGSSGRLKGVNPYHGKEVAYPTSGGLLAGVKGEGTTTDGQGSDQRLEISNR